jgi:LysW-gamma-L-lysine carboxypeptidase
VLFRSRARPHPNTTIHVIAAVGEETPESPGARHIARTHRADACIIGEPSGASGFALGYKGRLLLHANFAQTHAHSAGPQGSATDAAFRWWNAVLQLVHHANPTPEGIFDSLQASIRDITSTTDGLTDSATLHAGFRLPTRIAPHELEHKIRNIPDPPTRLTFSGHTPAFRAARDNDVASALAAAIRDENLTPRPQLKTGTADMNIVAPIWNCPIAAYGPGDSALDHTPREHINLDEFTQSIRILTRAIEMLSHRLARAE